MTRYVVRNRTLTPADGGPDVRDSYFENCTLTGDFTGFDFRNVSLNGCTLIGNFSTIQHTYMTSVRCDWRQATLPPDVSSYKHDMVIGVLAQALSRLSPARRAAVQDVIGNVDGQYTHSWRDSLRRLLDAGLTKPQIRTFLLDAFAGYPKLLARLEDVVAEREGAIAGAVPAPVPLTSLLDVSGTFIDLVSDPRVNTHDRWAVERSLEVPGVWVHVFTLLPYPYAISTLESMAPARWDWWSTVISEAT